MTPLEVFASKHLSLSEKMFGTIYQLYHNGKEVGFFANVPNTCNGTIVLYPGISGIKPESLIVGTKSWLIGGLIPKKSLTEFCLDNNIQPKWTTVVSDAVTGAKKVEYTAPNGEKTSMVMDDSGNYRSVSGIDNKLIFAGAALLLGLVILRR